MNYIKVYILKLTGILLLIFTTYVTSAQQKSIDQNLYGLPFTENITFNDTVFNIAFDSLRNNLGTINPVNTNLVKYFKYVGSDPLYISTSWTTDPHMICEYPTEQLIPGKIYSYKICFWHQGRQGEFYKTLGFYLSDGNRVTLMFYGNIVPADEK